MTTFQYTVGISDKDAQVCAVFELEISLIAEKMSSLSPMHGTTQQKLATMQQQGSSIQTFRNSEISQQNRLQAISTAMETSIS